MKGRTPPSCGPTITPTAAVPLARLQAMIAADRQGLLEEQAALGIRYRVAVRLKNKERQDLITKGLEEIEAALDELRVIEDELTPPVPEERAG